ncbi:hypothetical protein [Viridibacillus arvi]|uniref:hypothetical protein n=1 Tax=Viridibacillus arvi TaxID=263475 RepID=UPI0034D003B0
MTKALIDEQTVVNTNTIADMFGVQGRRVRQMVEEEIITKVGHGRFNLKDTVKRYVTYLKLQNEKNGEKEFEESFDHEKYLHEQAKRKKTEIELAQLQNRVHDAEDVERVMNHMNTAFRAKILSVPSKLALQLVNIEEAEDVQEILAATMREVLLELSEYDAAMFITDEEDEKGEESNGEAKDN